MWRLQSFAAVAVVGSLCAKVAASSPGQDFANYYSQSNGACVGSKAGLGNVFLAKTAILNHVKLELQEPAPAPPQTVLATEMVHRGSVPTDGGAATPTIASARFQVADLAKLLVETRAFGAAATEAEASAIMGGDDQTALVSKRAAEAAARDIESFATGSLALFNPSLAEMPVSWRRTKERWLGCFRQSTSSNRNTSLGLWWSNSIVLAVLDDDLRLARPLRILRSGDFFKDF